MNRVIGESEYQNLLKPSTHRKAEKLIEIFNKLIESLNKGNIFLAVTIAMIALIFNFKKIIEFIDDRNLKAV